MANTLTPRSAINAFHCHTCNAKPGAAQTTVFDEHPPACRMFWCEPCKAWRPISRAERFTHYRTTPGAFGPAVCGARDGRMAYPHHPEDVTCPDCKIKMEA